MLVVIGGCGDDDVGKYDGQTAEEWIAQAKTGNSYSRAAAYQALRAFPNNKDAMALLERTLANESAPFPERMLAAQSLYRATRDTKRVVPKAAEAIRLQADVSRGGQYSTKELEDLVFWLGSSAKPLAIEIQYARSRLDPRVNPAVGAMRAKFDALLRDIAKS
jgi:hypothetical protein